MGTSLIWDPRLRPGLERQTGRPAAHGWGRRSIEGHACAQETKFETGPDSGIQIMPGS